MKQRTSILSALVLVGSASWAAADGQTADADGPTAAASPDERTRLLGDPARLRSAAESYGLASDATAIGDYSIVLDGGANKRGIAARYLIEAGLTLDTEIAFGWSGGTLRAAYLGFHGDNGNRDSGDAQVYSNIDEAPFDALYSLWYRQVLFEDRIAIKLGKMDANADFAYVDNGDGFLNSSPGFSPTIQAFPSYPDPAAAVNLFMETDTGPYAGVGVYDGATQAGIRTGTRGPDTFFGKPSDLLWIGEAGTRYELAGLPGRIGLGYWNHTGEFERFDGDTNDEADGIYIVLDQTLYDSADSSRALDAFAQYGRADEATSAITTHASAGMQATALLAGRPNDVTGLMASYVAFSDAPGAGFVNDHELVIEAFHEIALANWLSLKPDLQYIINPGGMGLEDATVGTLRAELIF